jgi:tRNA(Ser,Leu) C12 N-acetylase TAN1
LGFKQMERVTVGISMGDKPVDIEMLKKGSTAQIEQDQENNMLLWHVGDLPQETSSILQIASERLSFEDIFPIEVRFEETYSLINMNVEKAASVTTGDALSVKTLHSLTSDNYKIYE